MAEDYYEVLGIPRSATRDEIQKAYRNMARKYHPDLNPDDKSAREKFQKVQAAFDILNDEEKRTQYDRYGHTFDSSGAGPGERSYQWAGGGGQSFEDVDLSEIFGGFSPGGGGFGDMFGFGRQARGGPTGARTRPEPGAARGADLTTELQIPFNTAVLGGEAAVTVQRAGGKQETLSVKIPAGIEDGKKIRLRGQGEQPARGGPKGDILITVRVAPHPYFTRRGKRLDVKVPITLGEAAAGAKVDVPTPRGTITLSVPPGTSSGRKLRIKGHGVALPGEEAGDLFAEIQIVMPPDLSEEERDLLRQLSEKHRQNPRASLRW